MGGSAKPPPPPPEVKKPAPPPKLVDDSIQDARKKQMSETRAKRGRNSTILTGALGVQTDATLGTKTLLGA